MLISFKFVSQHYEDGSFILFKYLFPILKNYLTVTLPKFTIFPMLINIQLSEHDITGYNFPLFVLISFKFVSLHYEDGSFILFKYLFPILKNYLTVTLPKFTIFTMLINIQLSEHDITGYNFPQWVLNFSNLYHSITRMVALYYLNI